MKIRVLVFKCCSVVACHVSRQFQPYSLRALLEHKSAAQSEVWQAVGDGCTMQLLHSVSILYTDGRCMLVDLRRTRRADLVVSCTCSTGVRWSAVAKCKSNRGGIIIYSLFDTILLDLFRIQICWIKLESTRTEFVEPNCGKMLSRCYFYYRILINVTLPMLWRQLSERS